MGDEVTGWLDWAVAASPIAGESVCGDAHYVNLDGERALIAVSDGLGHGLGAATASAAAIRAIQASPWELLPDLVTRVHRSLRDTRGVALSVASFDAREATMCWVGVGNVEGVLLRARHGLAPTREWLLHRGGVVGYNLPTLRPSLLHLAPGDLVVFATDGLRSGFAEAANPRRTPQEQAGELLSGWARHTDDALVLVARYLG